jgi:diguanylate cyclase (GGDEF)-like protein/PAS domain S-box-containing protein
MGLRTRTFTTLTIIMVVLFVALFLVARPSLNYAFNRLERDRAKADGERLVYAYGQELERLERIAADWAPRNVTLEYMRTGDPAFEQELTAESLAHAGLNLMLFIDEAGNVTLARFVDLDLGTFEEPDPVLVKSILTTPRLLSPSDPRASISGAIGYGDEQVLLVASRSITSSDLYEAPEGTLVVGRYFDQTAVADLSEATRLEVVAFPANQWTLTTTDGAVLSKFTVADSVRVAEVDERRMGAYTVIRDLDGRQLVLVRADVPREVRSVGGLAMLSFAVALLLVGVVATASVSLVIDRAVLHRIDGLSSEMAQVAIRRDLSSRMTVRGNDEIASLATDINDALAAIEETELELVHARDELETRVFERTEKLHEQEQRYRSLVERLADGVFIVDTEGVVTFANRRAGEIAERPLHEIIGADFRTLLSPASAEEVERRMQAGAAHLSGLTLEVKMGDAACGPAPVELRAVPLLDEAEQPAGTQWIARDIAERKRFEEQLVHMANHDYLTGLFNRQFFESALDIELAESRRTGQGGAILWLDVDDFKEVNDSLGHRAGDEVLVALATRLRTEVRESSVLSRLGGDEFAMLLPNTDVEEAESVAERLLSAINSHVYTAQSRPVRLSASIGVVLYPLHGSTPSELLANADVAMYLAKASGRSCVHMHEVDASVQSEMLSRLTWNERLTEALAEDRFLVYAQPILDLRTGAIGRYEFLVRMLVDDDVISPAEFLPAAERLGIIRDIDRWMVKQAVKALQADVLGDATIEVNLSGRAFGDQELLSVIEEELKASGVQPQRLGFEITETAAIADMAKARRFICTLKQLGCRFSLDDFGSGFSSFYYLKHLPIDALKVDGSFVRSLPESPQDQHLVRGIVELCRGLGVEIAVEYVEDEQTLELVRGLGVDLAQGYHIGRPQSLAGFVQQKGGVSS